MILKNWQRPAASKLNDKEKVEKADCRVEVREQIYWLHRCWTVVTLPRQMFI
jgi:hypothetical protein